MEAEQRYATCGGDMDELELYPRVDPLKAVRNGLRSIRTHWRRALAYTLAILVLVGFGGYRWMTTVTPMDSTRAVELFRAEQASTADTDPDRDRGTSVRSKKEKGPRGDDGGARKGRGTKLVAAAPVSGAANKPSGTND